MNVTTDHASGIAIVRVGESRLMYPLLSEFASVVTQLLASGERKVIVEYLTERKDRSVEAARQVVWSLLTGSEFRFNY